MQESYIKREIFEKTKQALVNDDESKKLRYSLVNSIVVNWRGVCPFSGKPFLTCDLVNRLVFVFQI